MNDKIAPITISAKVDDSDDISSISSDKLKLDSIIEGLGSFGNFQKIQFILICLPMIFVSMHVMSWTFVVEPARRTCDLNENTTNITCIEQAFSASDRWHMDHENRWIRSTVQSVYFIGQMIGSFSCGVMADKRGRKNVLFLCIVLQVTSAFLMIIAPTWWLYAIAKAGTGFTQPGIFGVSIVLGVELVGAKHRRLISVIANIFIAIGAAFLALLAYFILDYRLLHAAIAFPSLLFLSYWWIIRESARWLFSQGRFDEANTVLCATAVTNKKNLPNDWVERVEKKHAMNSKTNNFGAFDLIRTPQMRKRTMANFIMWPITTMMYYGLTMKSDVGGGNLFITFTISSLIEIPAQLVVFVLIDKTGRRALYSGSIFTAGLLLLSNLLTSSYVPQEVSVAQLMLVKACVSTAYTTMYTYTSELFPTVIRNTAVGCCSMIARFGAIIASFFAFYLVPQYGRVVMIIPFTVLAITASLISLIVLPETMGKELPSSISEVEGHEI